MFSWVINLKINIEFSTIKFFIDSFINLLRYAGWQILLFIIFIKYRNDVRDMLMFTSQRISKLSINKVSIEFANTVNKIQKEVGKGSKDSLQDDEEFNKLVSLRPDYAILDSWKDVEFELEKIFPEVARRSINYNRELSETGLLNQKDIEILNKLRKLRNKVVHATKIYISKETAEKYRNQCMYIINKLEDAKNLV